MRVTRLTTSEELDALAPSWNCLSRGVPFRTWQWLATWWKNYGSGHELYTLAVHTGEDVLVGLAPFCRERHPTNGNVLSWLGSGEVCSDYLTILSSHEYEEAVGAALATWLIEHSSHREHAWDLLKLDGITTADSGLTGFVDILSAGGCSLHRRSDVSAWRIPLPPDWATFLANYSKSRRKHIRRWYRTVTEDPVFKVHLVSTPGELARGMQVLVDLHQRRFISRGEPGCFASTQFSDFLHESAERLLQSEMLELWWLEMDGRPIAAELDLTDGNVVYAYQSGVDPVSLEHSPGNLLATAVLHYAIENGRHSYDFLRGDEAYKQQWKATPVELLRCRVAANRVGSQLRHGVWTAGATLKDWVKGGLTLAGLH